MNDGITHFYIGRHGVCGCCLAVCVDDPKRDIVSEHVTDWVKSGLTVSRIKESDWSAIKFGHQCEKKRRENELKP